MAPNGAVMRTAITGIPFFWDADTVEQSTLDFCASTHADPRCSASCVAVTECVRLLMSQAATDRPSDVETMIDAALARAEQQLVSTGTDQDGDNCDVVEEFRRHALAETLDELGLDDGRNIGYTFKCCGAGLWALRQASELCNKEPAAVRSGVEHIFQQICRAGGDADTNNAVAGALVGALVGFDNLPWVDELPYGCISL